MHNMAIVAHDVRQLLQVGSMSSYQGFVGVLAALQTAHRVTAHLVTARLWMKGLLLLDLTAQGRWSLFRGSRPVLGGTSSLCCALVHGVTQCSYCSGC